MATNLHLDDKLIDEARRVGGHRTKRETVTAALREYVRQHRVKELLELAGTIDFDPKYKYKRERQRR
ncbi:MAG: type II toxin-antitoxin system VapB family antitoxin [Terriglobales bacterium]